MKMVPVASAEPLPTPIVRVLTLFRARAEGGQRESPLLPLGRRRAGSAVVVLHLGVVDLHVERSADVVDIAAEVQDQRGDAMLTPVLRRLKSPRRLGQPIILERMDCQPPCTISCSMTGPGSGLCPTYEPVPLPW